MSKDVFPCLVPAGQEKSAISSPIPGTFPEDSTPGEIVAHSGPKSRRNGGIAVRALPRVDGEKAHAVALVSHANVWLAGLVGPEPTGPPADGASCKFISKTTFVYVGGPGKADVVHSIDGWMRQLANRRVERLWFLTSPPGVVSSARGKATPERQLAGFVGGGNRWTIVGQGPGHVEAWTATWAVGDQNAPEQRIWKVTYRGEPVNGNFLQPKVDLAAASAELSQALVAIRDHAASDPHLKHWTETFDAALASGTSSAPMPAYYPDMLPEKGYSLASRRLLAMARGSNVFGGMGSWNDGDPSDPQLAARHEAVSQGLYVAMLAGISAAVNADLEGDARPKAAPPPAPGFWARLLLRG